MTKEFIRTPNQELWDKAIEYFELKGYPSNRMRTIRPQYATCVGIYEGSLAWSSTWDVFTEEAGYKEVFPTKQFKDE